MRAAGSFVKRCDKNDPFPFVPKGSRLALLANFLQVAVDAGLRDAQRGGGAGHGALEHKHAVAVEVANDVHAVALAKRRYIQPARAQQLGNAAVDELLCGLRRLSTSIGAGSVRVGAASKQAMSCCAMALMERTVERSVLTQSMPTISLSSRIKYVADSTSCHRHRAPHSP